MKEKEIAKIRKNNMKLHPIYQMLGLDYIFYYGISVLFLSQVKGISDSNIVLANSIYAIFSIIMQIPMVVVVNKLGKRKSIILANILRATAIVLVMLCMNFAWLIFAYFVMATAFAITGISSSPILNDSLPETESKGKIFSHIDSKGYSRYCYIAAASTIIAGYLYQFNPYIPLFLCIGVTIFVIIIAWNFIETNELEGKEKKEITLKENLQDVKEGFDYIFHSGRLRALILMLGLIWGLLCLLSTYQTTLLKNCNVSAFSIGIIAAVVQILTGASSKKADEVNRKLKNKTLTTLALSMTIGAIIIGITMLLKIPFYVQFMIIVTIFCLRHLAKGIYQILKKRYMGNFASADKLTKIYATNGIVSNIIRAIVEYIGSFILLWMPIQQATLVVGILFTIITIIIAIYMKPRIGIIKSNQEKIMRN